jgi:hypothetical protein
MIARESLNLQTPYELPAGKLEELIASVFAEVFELDRIGAADEFFDVGGDSLLGEVLSERITQRTGQDFQISDLFEHGSPREIARFLFAKSTQPAMGAGGRPPIFLIHGRVGFTLPKPEFRKVFGESQEFHLFELPGIRGGQSYDRLEDIAAVYVAQLVERYPRGPILIVSFCVGALIALEMAAQEEGGTRGRRGAPAGFVSRASAVAKGARRRAADRRQARRPGRSVAIIPREASDQRGAGPLKNAWRAAVGGGAGQASVCAVALQAAQIRRTGRNSRLA